MPNETFRDMEKRAALEAIDSFLDTGFEIPNHLDEILIKEAGATIVSLPVGTRQEIEQSIETFQGIRDSLSPVVRAQIGIKLASVAKTNHALMAPAFAKYANTKFSPFAELELEKRAELAVNLSPEAMFAYQRLQELLPRTNPVKLAMATTLYDDAFGLTEYYGSKLNEPVPYMLSKVGEEYPDAEAFMAASWNVGDDVLTSNELRDALLTKEATFREYFADSITDQLQENPEAVFDAMPDGFKSVVLRIVKS